MNFRKLSVIALVLSLWACGKDEPEEINYSFIDQDAAGLIDNEAWTYGDGSAYPGNETFTIRLRQTQTAGSGCDDIGIVGARIVFTAKNKVGVYKLNSHSYAYFMHDDEAHTNIKVIEGAYEITSVGTSINGRVDFRTDEGNFVNGDFTVPRCNP